MLFVLVIMLCLFVDVRLVLGPILGLVTTSTVNVMVEVDNSCELAFYVFEMSPLVQEGRFSHVKVVLINV